MSVLSLPSVWATGPPHRAGSPSGEDYASDFLLMPRGTGFPASSSCPRGPLTSIPCCTCLLGKVKVKVAWSCPAVCDPMDHTVHGILQARTLEWVAYPISRGSSQPRNQTRAQAAFGLSNLLFTGWWLPGGALSAWQGLEGTDYILQLLENSCH